MKHLRYHWRAPLLLSITGASYAVVHTREARTEHVFAKGYPYVLDLSATIGHKAPLSDGDWHPTQENYCLTSSEDGSLRQWDLHKAAKGSVDVVKLKAALGKRSLATACCYSSTGGLIAAAGSDGNVFVWQAGKGSKFVFPDVSIKAHEPETDTSCLRFVPGTDDRLLASRGGDHTLRIWDLRKATSPVAAFADLENSYGMTDLEFSPDGRLLLTGTSNKLNRQGASAAGTAATGESEAAAAAGGAGGADGGEAGAGAAAAGAGRRGMLAVFRTDTWAHLTSLAMTDKSVVRTCWHPALNQVFAACSDGAVKVLYDPARSTKGVLLAVGRKARPKPLLDFVGYEGEIVVPGSESDPMRRNREIKKMRKALTPAAPDAAHKFNQSSLLHHALLKHVDRKAVIAGTDPREALLKLGGGPNVYTAAYERTQPAPVFREDPNEVEVDLTKKKAGK